MLPPLLGMAAAALASSSRVSWLPSASWRRAGPRRADDVGEPFRSRRLAFSRWACRRRASGSFHAASFLLLEQPVLFFSLDLLNASSVARHVLGPLIAARRRRDPIEHLLLPAKVLKRWRRCSSRKKLSASHDAV